MSRQIFLGGRNGIKKISVGGNSPISVQSMWKKSLVPATNESLRQIVFELNELKMFGLDIMRFAVPDAESADALKKLSTMTDIPLVADIHFDYKLALQCMEKGFISAIRINPGNIGGPEKVKAVVERARDCGIALRIGVNSGSIPKDLVSLLEVDALVKAAEREMELFDNLNFKDYAVSLKASDIETTVLANEKFAKKYDTPIHLGVTEAGPAITGAIKTAIAFYRLISNGIGDTIRVSLSDKTELEVIAAIEILRACGQNTKGVTLISCPRCGRNGFDVHAFLDRWQSRLYRLKKDVKIAIMGCAVNGPGEAKSADIGITGSEDIAIIFKAGKIVKTLHLKNYTQDEKIKIVDDAFENELKTL